MVSTPCDDGHRFCFWQSLLASVSTEAPDGVRLIFCPTPGDSWIGRIRTNIINTFYFDTFHDALVFLDSDLDFRPADLHRLIQTCMEQDGIVCGLYYKKQEELGGVFNTIMGQDISTAPNAGAQEIAAGGTGAMVIPRWVVARMIDAATTGEWNRWPVRYIEDGTMKERWHLFHDGVIDDAEAFPHSPRLMSEDWSFCYMARKLGIKIWLEPAAVFMHEGNCLYPKQARRLTKEEVDTGQINQPDGTTTPAK